MQEASQQPDDDNKIVKQQNINSINKEEDDHHEDPLEGQDAQIFKVQHGAGNFFTPLKDSEGTPALPAHACATVL